MLSVPYALYAGTVGSLPMDGEMGETLNWSLISGASCYEIRGNQIGASGYANLTVTDPIQTAFTS